MRHLNPHGLPLVLAALALHGTAFAGFGRLDAGLYTGLVVPGGKHDLYAPTEAEYKALNPGPVLGGRFSYRPLEPLGGEVEAYGAAASTGGGGALMFAYRAQMIVLPPLSLPKDIAPFAVAGLGNIGVSSASDALGSDTDWSVHAGLGAQMPLNEKLALRLDVRYLFADGNTTLSSPGGHTEVLLGMGYRLTPEEDVDGDGFVDSRDSCANEPETENGYLDEDGCPDALGEVSILVEDADGVVVPDVLVVAGGQELGRTDGVGRLRTSGLMPETTLQISGSHFHMAGDATALLTVAEGLNEVTLVTQWLPGRVRVVTRNNEGPIVNAAASFIGPKEVEPSIVESGDKTFYLHPGGWSVIVAAASFGTERRELDIAPDQDALVVIEVELAPAKVEVTREEMVILEKILFEVGSASIDQASMGLLQELANNIVAHDGIRRLEIQGHTDSTGSSRDNKKLSQARVESVRDELVKRGVSADILQAVGYGEEVSIASNDSEEGRAKNRRVQFLILEQELGTEPK